MVHPSDTSKSWDDEFLSTGGHKMGKRFCMIASLQNRWSDVSHLLINIHGNTFYNYNCTSNIETLMATFPPFLYIHQPVSCQPLLLSQRG
jgi:hypothetical protein